MLTYIRISYWVRGHYKEVLVNTISPRVVFCLFDPNEFYIFQLMSACIEVYSYFRHLFCHGWFMIFSSVLVDSTYCREHLLHVTRSMTFFDLQFICCPIGYLVLVLFLWECFISLFPWPCFHGHSRLFLKKNIGALYVN